MTNPLRRLYERVFKERFKGYFDTGKTRRGKHTRFYPGEHSWKERCVHYDQTVERHGMAKQATLTIAGQLVAEGVFTSAKERDNKPYPRSEEAQQHCDDLNEQIGLDTMLYDTGVTIAKYGSCFWEKTWTPQFDVRLIPMQEAIEPAEVDDVGNITRWRQNLWAAKTPPSWSSNEIVHFAWNITTQSWPYGTSILVGLETILDTLEELEVNANKYMEKQAYPYEVLQLGDGTFMPTPAEVSSVDSKWKSRDVGENIITTYPTQMHQGGTGGAPIRELSNILDFLYDEVIDATMIPPISKQYNATEASAKVMMPHAHATLITPMQRLIRRKIEGEIYKPYLEDLGFSVKTCPKLLFAPPDAHKEEDGEYYSKLVTAGIAPPRWAAKKLGIPEEEWDEWQKEEEAKQEKMMQQQKEGQDEGEEGKSYRVTELYKHKCGEKKKGS